MTDVTMRQLLEVGVHFGHQTRFWCPKMSPYIYGHRNKIHIINLEKTLSMFNDAMNYLSAVASKRGSVMFVGTKSQAGTIVQAEAQRAGSPYVYHRWLGGMLTNYTTVRQSVDRLKELEDLIQSESYSKMSKKEAMRIERERFRLNRNLAGIRNMKGLPEALFVVDVKHENIAIKEANKLGIPVVAIVDTNCDPEGVDYVIPGNDDSISAIKLYCRYAADAVLDGYATIQNDPFIYDGDAEGDVEAMVDTGVTSAKAAVAPDDSDLVPELDGDSAEPLTGTDDSAVEAAATEPEPEVVESADAEPGSAVAESVDAEPEPAVVESADSDSDSESEEEEQKAEATAE